MFTLQTIRRAAFAVAVVSLIHTADSTRRGGLVASRPVDDVNEALGRTLRCVVVFPAAGVALCGRCRHPVW